MSSLDINRSGGKAVIRVKVVPGSSRTAAAGIWNGMLKVKVAAPPEKGKANESLVGFLARSLGIRARDITIVSGHSSTIKKVEIAADVDVSRLEQMSYAREGAGR